MANGRSPLQNILMFVGGINSFLYIAIGILFLLGKITLGLDVTLAKLLGGAVLAYGLFRLYLFFQRYKRMREEE